MDQNDTYGESDPLVFVIKTLIKGQYEELAEQVIDAFAPAEILYTAYDYHIGLLSNTDGKEIKFYQIWLIYY